MKSSSYMTRALQSRDRRYAEILGKLGYSAHLNGPAGHGQQGNAPDPRAAGHELVGREATLVDPLAALRDEYHDAVGKKAFHGWDADTLKAKIAEAKDAN